MFIDLGVMYTLRKLRNSIGRYLVLTGSELEGRES